MIRSQAVLSARRRRRSSAGSQTIVSDTFTRANTIVAPGTADTGQTWVEGTGAWGIDANQLYLTADAGVRHLVWIDSGVSDCTVQHTVSTHTSNAAHGQIMRVADSSNYLLLLINANTALYLYKCVATVLTLIGQDEAVTNASGDVIKAVLSGTSITIYQNGVQKIAATESAGQTNTKHGISTESATEITSRFDDFRVTVP